MSGTGQLESGTAPRNVSAFLGVSLGSRYYSVRRLRLYIHWARTNALSFSFLIGDTIYGLTYSVFNRCSPEDGTKVAVALGDQVVERIQAVMAKESFNARVIRWPELESSPHYRRLHDAFQQRYSESPAFVSAVREEVQTNLNRRLTSEVVSRFESEDRGESWRLLDDYVIAEMAGLITMSEYMGFPLEVYPGPDVTMLQRLYTGGFPNLSDVLPVARHRSFLNLRFA